jgi:hypothetical protein
MRSLFLALGLSCVLLAGCGSSSKAEAKPNGEATKPADRVLADADAAATSASSVHVAGKVSSNGTPIVLDLSMTHSKRAKGSMSTNGVKFDLVRIADALYIRGSDAFYKRFAGPAAQLLHGKWVKASATKGPLSTLAPLTDIHALFARIEAGHGTLDNDGKKSYKGRQVVEIRDTSDNSRLLVSATGTPYPIAIAGGKKSQSGTITFGDWNVRVSVSPPNGVVDISELTG